MTTVAVARRSLAGRAWGFALGIWGAVMGLLPHVLHHVGPLAGAAVLAGATGRVLFAVIGFVAAVPLLLRLYRRFETWRAPAIAVALFAMMFLVSTFIVGPVVSGGSAGTEPTVEQQHSQHH